MLGHNKTRWRPLKTPPLTHRLDLTVGTDQLKRRLVASVPTVDRRRIERALVYTNDFFFRFRLASCACSGATVGPSSDLYPPGSL
ncbi:BQ5605_C038g11737 [Microbotryum silenes-dioicae]|uniref:BQ5605_C038g11737 protein n=1 Tax=Microbotryum silenes-dioicae TaxID=796604 RepID=A0A2X0PA36_9BASI|nr:BQ5605_C038g11737 [Microbotryum silenes-dioicae]